MAKLQRVASVVDTLEVFIVLDEDELVLRVEILRQLDAPDFYSTRIWRVESYRLQSSFPQDNGAPRHDPSDELIIKEFEGFESFTEPTRFSSIEDARSEALRQLSEWAATLH